MKMKINLLLPLLFIISFGYSQDRIMIYNSPPPASELDCSIPKVTKAEKTFKTAQEIPYSYFFHGIDHAKQLGWTGAGVKVAVLDTGNTPHNDLPSSKVIKDYTGDVNCCDDHSNHVTGTVAALDNNFGVLGLASPDIYDYRILDSSGQGSSTRIAQSIRDAADDGMQVLSMSFGSPSPSQTLRDACAYAIGKGCILVAAAGNDGPGPMIYPAAWPEIISVFAIDKNMVPASFSSVGDGLVSSGGVSVKSTIGNNQYGSFNGTSMSTPAVTATISIIIEYLAANDQFMTQGGMIDLLKDISTDIHNPGYDEYTGYGLPDLSKIITKDKNGGNPIVEDPRIEQPSKNSAFIFIGILALMLGLLLYSLNLSKSKT